MSLRAHWIATWERLGATAPSGTYEELMARYAEAHRHYHTARHLEECFRELEDIKGEAERPAEVELGLWFHDAIYETTRHDNEERSAAWARAVVLSAGLDGRTGDRVAALIIATQHDRRAVDADARVLVDVDLSILGASADRFDEYERDVRREYAWVPDFVFDRKRRKILLHFLERPCIYETRRFRETRETRARANLTRSLQGLQ